MISPKIPAASAGIAAGAGPSTRTADWPPSRFVSVLVATNHDPPARPEAVTRTGDRVAVAGASVVGAPLRRSGPARISYTDSHQRCAPASGPSDATRPGPGTWSSARWRLCRRDRRRRASRLARLGPRRVGGVNQRRPAAAAVAGDSPPGWATWPAVALDGGGDRGVSFLGRGWRVGRVEPARRLSRPDREFLREQVREQVGDCGVAAGSW